VDVCGKEREREKAVSVCEAEKEGRASAARRRRRLESTINAAARTLCKESFVLWVPKSPCHAGLLVVIN
jgi:hypothetical protein